MKLETSTSLGEWTSPASLSMKYFPRMREVPYEVRFISKLCLGPRIRFFCLYGSFISYRRLRFQICDHYCLMNVVLFYIKERIQYIPHATRQNSSVWSQRSLKLVRDIFSSSKFKIYTKSFSYVDFIIFFSAVNTCDAVMEAFIDFAKFFDSVRRNILIDIYRS